MHYMPEVFRIGNLRFCMYFKDHAPPHIHVLKAGAEAQFNLLTLECIESRGFTQKALREIQRILSQVEEDLLEVWDDYQK
jgi:hypothetical protein